MPFRPRQQVRHRHGRSCRRTSAATAGASRVPRGRPPVLAGSSWAQIRLDQPPADVSGPQPVARKAPNAYGLFDMLGNVWEWVWDYADTARYADYRTLRGGGWADRPWSCRASVRRGSAPDAVLEDVGFRVARGVVGAHRFGRGAGVVGCGRSVPRTRPGACPIRLDAAGDAGAPPLPPRGRS